MRYYSSSKPTYKQPYKQRYEWIFTFFVILLACMPGLAFARTMHAGLPSEQLWFSKDPFFAGDTITIFTLIFNSSNYRLSGTMTLKDGTSTLNTKPFVVDGLGGSQVVTFPLLMTKGNHSFSAVITQGELSQNGTTQTDAFIIATHTPKVMRFADDDKNQNGIGDSLEPPLPPSKPIVLSATTTPPSTVPTSKDVRREENFILANAPTPIVNAAVPVLGAIEDFRVTEAVKALRNLSQIEGELHASITTSKGNGWELLGSGITSGEVAKSPFEHLKLFIALIMRFFTANPYAFYIVLLLVLYKLVRMIISLFF